jgi:hypothetical protein
VPDAAERGPGEADVLISYRETAISRQWLPVFAPLLGAWLSEDLGRPARVRCEEPPPVDSIDPSAVRGARCFIVLATPTYMNDPAARRLMSQIDASGSHVLALRLQGEGLRERRSSRWHEVDFSGFAFVGEGFARSSHYVDFQQRVQRVAQEVAAHLTEAAGRGEIVVAQ